MAANQVATNFYNAFVNYLQSESGEIKQAKSALKSYMSKNFNLKFSGTPGIVSNAYGTSTNPLKMTALEIHFMPMGFPMVVPTR
jgi:hypothetical protein